jgi:prophage regulatory protein
LILCFSLPASWFLASIAMLPLSRECPMTRKLVSKKELKSVYGVPYSFAHIARLEVAGQFPRRVRLGACRVAWVADEVQTWIDERVARRDMASPS